MKCNDYDRIIVVDIVWNAIISCWTNVNTNLTVYLLLCSFSSQLCSTFVLVCHTIPVKYIWVHCWSAPEFGRFREAFAKHCVCLSVCEVKTPTFKSRSNNLLQFVCLALKSSLRIHGTDTDRAARSPSGRPNGDAALNLATLRGTLPTPVTGTRTDI